jgi:hypothetical protein
MKEFEVEKDVIIFESAIAEYLNTGHLYLSSSEATLSRPQVIRHLQGIIEAAEQRNTIRLRILRDRNPALPYSADNFYSGSLVEPIGCCVRGFKGLYHTDYTTYTRTDGAKRGGKLAILGGAGPMGFASIELAIGYAGCSQVVVTDINQERLDYAQAMCTPASAKARGCDLVYLNTTGLEDPVCTLLEISDGGFDDVLIMVPVAGLMSMAEQICGFDGCINFFAGPPVHDLAGSLNLYRVHYDGIHLVGTAGSIPEDTVDTIELICRGLGITLARFFTENQEEPDTDNRKVAS